MTKYRKTSNLGKAGAFAFSQKEAKEIRKNFIPITNLDHLALYLDGTKFSPESFDRFFDSNLRKKGAQAFNLKWIKQGGAKVDQLAMSIQNDVQGYNTKDESEIIEDIQYLVTTYPAGFTEYYYEATQHNNQDYNDNASIEDMENEIEREQSNEAFEASIKKALKPKTRLKRVVKTVTKTVTKRKNVNKTKQAYTPELAVLKRFYALHNKAIKVTQLTSLQSVLKTAIAKAISHKQLLKTIKSRLELAIFKLEGNKITKIKKFEISKDLLTPITAAVTAPKVKQVTLGGADDYKVKNEKKKFLFERTNKKTGFKETVVSELQSIKGWKKVKQVTLGGLKNHQKQYNKEVDAYKWFVINPIEKKVISGWEDKGDALDVLKDESGKCIVVAKTSLKKLGIADPTESWKHKDTASKKKDKTKLNGLGNAENAVNYKGYDIKLVKDERLNSWGWQIYKGQKYIYGLKGSPFASMDLSLNDAKKQVKKIISKTKLNGLGEILTKNDLANIAKNTVASAKSPFQTMDKLVSGGTYQLPGELGKLLGNLGEIDCSITIRGDQGAGKSQLMWQLVDDFAEIGKDVAVVSPEMNGSSPTISSYRDKYIKPKNQNKVLFTDKKLTVKQIKDLSNAFDVVFVDSFNQLENYEQSQFDWLCKQLPNKCIIGLFQSTTGGEMRGGNKPEFDAYVNIEVVKVDDSFVNNYAVCTKNRFGGTGLKYNISTQKIMPIKTVGERSRTNSLNGVARSKTTKKVTKKVSKSVEASKVLKLMDDDYSYQDALKLVLSNNKNVDKAKLVKELNKYI